MRHALRSSIGLLVFVAAFAIWTFASHASPAPLGPGAILEMHTRFFKAVDSGDADAVRAFFDGESDAPSFLCDASGKPVRAQNAKIAGDELARLAAQTKRDGGYTTSMTVCKCDCPSGPMAYAVLELERKPLAKDGAAQHWRATSLVKYEKDGGWKLFHLHLSPADAPSEIKVANK
jgi:ketosteroid isomerase-like protein